MTDTAKSKKIGFDPQLAIRFGANLRLARESLGMNQATFAKHIGARYQTMVSRLETGEQEPGLGMLVQIADRLGISVQELIDGTGGLKVLRADALSQIQAAQDKLAEIDALLDSAGVS